MTVVSLVSAKHSPGTTIAALGLAYTWAARESTVLIELDRDGGDLVAMCDLTHDGPGVLSLAAAGRHIDSEVDLESHCQEFGGHRLSVIPGAQLPTQMDSAIELLDRRATSLTRTDHSLIIDGGRFRSTATIQTVVRQSDLVLIVMRPNVVECHAVAARLNDLRAIDSEIALLLVGERPYGSSEVEAALQAPVAGVLADDKRGVESFLAAPDSKFSKSSPFLRSVCGIADHLCNHLNQSEVVA